MFVLIKSYCLRQAFIKSFLALIFLAFSSLAVADAGASYYRYPSQPTQTAPNIKWNLFKVEKQPWYKSLWERIKAQFKKLIRNVLIAGILWIVITGVSAIYKEIVKGGKKNNK